jgi:hypothetical protein
MTNECAQKIAAAAVAKAAAEKNLAAVEARSPGITAVHLARTELQQADAALRAALSEVK